MQLSIIIVNYNVQHFLEQCLTSVEKASTGIDVEVIVVDNNSVDQSLSMVRQKFQQVKVIANKENVGFSKNFYKNTSQKEKGLAFLQAL